MNELLSEHQMQQLFIANTPLLDVRAPIEFHRGAFPNAVNIPLLNDSEREQVGKIYRQSGKQAALALGYKLVDDTARQQRVAQWAEFLQQHPDARLYCFRGGLRSQIVQQWLTDAGMAIPRIAGGYKRMRHYLMQQLNAAVSACDPLVIAGKTGSGKTQLLNRFSYSIDLEGIAMHRGSAFGKRVQLQPSQINFENALAIQLLNVPFTKYRKLLLEDESRAIGSLSIPTDLYKRMKQAPLAVIEETLEFRVDTILRDYIQANFLDFKAANPQHYQQLFATYLLASLERIQRRLGATVYQEILADMQAAIAEHQRSGALEYHRNWIARLLQSYYDPMYEYQLGNKLDRIVFRGTSDEFCRWISHIKFEREI